MIVRFLGTGDAFGSGGRLQTCIHLQASTGVLIDCGATALIGMKRFGVDPESVDVVVLTHLHGDHFGGLAFLIRETQIASQRTKPLTVVGPAGHERVVREATDLLFPGASSAMPFDLRFVEYAAHVPLTIGNVTVLAVPGIHTLGTHPHAIRVEVDGRCIGYSGDTEWTEDLLAIASDADVFVCEAYRVDRVRNHMDYSTLRANQARLGCRRLVLTHMAPDVLALVGDDILERAYDGLTITT